MKTDTDVNTRMKTHTDGSWGYGWGYWEGDDPGKTSRHTTRQESEKQNKKKMEERRTKKANTQIEDVKLILLRARMGKRKRRNT